jgi:hypothetical protein
MGEDFFKKDLILRSQYHFVFEDENISHVRYCHIASGRCLGSRTGAHPSLHR